ncbi:MAG: hypothetical protein FWG68_05600 [Defluviitaleaceae bacterium]|nr:hypothetical protein [Defluviitaleaceae bacterium]
MKKNVIIAGVPRAGKSTLSRIIAKNFGYQHVSMDAINAAFERVFPELGINTYADMSSLEILYNISSKISPFIAAMIDSDSNEYYEFGRGMVIDVYQLLPDDYAKYLAKKNCEIFYLITSNVTPEERFVIQRKYDTEKDYTFSYSDEEIREGCEYIVEQSKLMKEQCQKHGLPYYETAKNRKTVFEQFVQMFAQKNL